LTKLTLNYFILTDIKKLIFGLFAVLIILLFSTCNKEKETDDGWNNCYDCPTGSWIGEFSGTCDYSNYNTNSNATGLPVTISIEETAPEYLTVYVNVTNYYSATVSGSLVSSYIISFAGTSASVTSTLDIKEQDLRLTGNSKKFHLEADSTELDEIINFVVNKVQ
jgi:hypothetical protein